MQNLSLSLLVVIGVLGASGILDTVQFFFMAMTVGTVRLAALYDNCGCKQFSYAFTIIALCFSAGAVYFSLNNNRLQIYIDSDNKPLQRQILGRPP